jgi:hypothetical protein
MYNQIKKINKMNPEINEFVTLKGVLLKKIFSNFFMLMTSKNRSMIDSGSGCDDRSNSDGISSHCFSFIEKESTIYINNYDLEKY